MRPAQNCRSLAAPPNVQLVKHMVNVILDGSYFYTEPPRDFFV